MHACCFKIICTLHILILFFVGPVLAQKSDKGYDYGKYESPQKYKSVTKFGVASLLWGHVPYTSEFKVLHDFTSGPYSSTQIGASLLTGGPLLKAVNPPSTSSQDKLTMIGFRFQATQKFYLSKETYAPEGFYIGPHFSYAECKLSTKSLMPMGYYYKLQQINACGVIGYQYISSSKFVADFFCGMGYKKNSASIKNGPGSSSLRPVDFYNDAPFYKGNVRIIMGINIGFARLAN